MSRIRPNGRKYLLLACAVVRHLIPGPRSEIGGRILDELERYAFAQPAKRMKGEKVDVWRDVIHPKFPKMPGRPLTVWKELGDDARWVSELDYRLHALNVVRAADVNAILDVAFFHVRTNTSSTEWWRLWWRSRVNLVEEQLAEANQRAAELIREVFGNPFRPPVIDPSWLLWNHGAVKHIAEHIATSGNFSDMPILADALEDAGCCDEELLRHCREERTHVPGCWALDAVLGRS